MENEDELTVYLANEQTPKDGALTTTRMTENQDLEVTGKRPPTITKITHFDLVGMPICNNHVEGSCENKACQYSHGDAFPPAEQAGIAAHKEKTQPEREWLKWRKDTRQAEEERKSTTVDPQHEQKQRLRPERSGIATRYDKVHHITSLLLWAQGSRELALRWYSQAHNLTLQPDAVLKLFDLRGIFGIADRAVGDAGTDIARSTLLQLPKNAHDLLVLPTNS